MISNLEVLTRCTPNTPRRSFPFQALLTRHPPLGPRRHSDRPTRGRRCDGGGTTWCGARPQGRSARAWRPGRRPSPRPPFGR
eukprot:1346529-Prymnesium_polylepis.1